MAFCICICLIWQPWPGRSPWFLLPRLLSPTKAHFPAPKVAFQKARISLQLLHCVWEGLPQGPQECREGLCQLCSRVFSPSAVQVGPGRGPGSPDHATLSRQVPALSFLSQAFLPPFFFPSLLLPSPPTWPLAVLGSFCKQPPLPPRDSGVIPKSRRFTSGGCISRGSLEKRKQ